MRTAFAVVLFIAWGCDDRAAPVGEGGRGAGGQAGGTITCLPPAASLLALDSDVLCIESAHWGNGLAQGAPIRWGRHGGPLQAIAAEDGAVRTLRWTAGDEGLEVVETELGTLPTGDSEGVILHDVVDLPFGERVAIDWREPTLSSGSLTIFDATGAIATHDVGASTPSWTGSALAVTGSEASWRLVYYGGAGLDGVSEGLGMYAADFEMGELVRSHGIATSSSGFSSPYAYVRHSSFDRNGNLFVSLVWANGFFGGLLAARANTVGVGAEAASFDRVPVSMSGGSWAALAPVDGSPGILLHGTSARGPNDGPKAVATFEEVGGAFAWSKSEAITTKRRDWTLVDNGDDEIWVIVDAPDDGGLCATDTAVYVLKRC